MRLAGAAVLLLLCMTTTVAGEETLLDLALSASNTYYGGGGDANDRNVVKVTPQIRILSRTERQRLRLTYFPGVQIFTEQKFDYYWDHRFMAEYQFELGQRTSVTMGDAYSDTEIVNFGNQLLPDDTVDVVSDATRFIRNNASMTFQHMFSPRLNVNVSFLHNFSNFDDPTRHDSETVGGGFNFVYVWSTKDRFGAGLQTSYSSFDGAKTPDTGVEDSGERNTNLHLSLSWNHQFTDRINLRFSGGPNLGFYETERLPEVEFNQYPSGIKASGDVRGFFTPADCPQYTYSSCGRPTAEIAPDTFGPNLTPEEAALIQVPLPPVPNPQVDDTKVNFFGALAIAYAGKEWTLRLNGRRAESTQSGVGTATAVTSVNLMASWEPTPRWVFGFNAGWNLRTNLASSVRLSGDLNLKDSVYTDLTGAPLLESSSLPTQVADRQIDRYQYRAWFQVNRRVFRDWWIGFSADYVRQERQDTRGTDRFRISASVKYDLPQIAF